jgi:hypothetical protein
MYDNKTGRWLYCDWLMEADWFDDRDGFLFIVPRPEIVAEVEGPDGPLLDAINAACRDHDELTEQDCERLGLLRVDEALKRFNPVDGYYHA